MGVGGQPHAPAASTARKDPVPIVQEAGWAPEPVWTDGKSRPHRDSIPDRPARSSVAIPTELPGQVSRLQAVYIYISSRLTYCLRGVFNNDLSAAMLNSTE